MSTMPDHRTRVTEEAFLALPESLDRIELLDGEVILSPSPSDEHQHILTLLTVELGIWARSHPPAAVRVAPLDIRLGPERILQPDLLVVLGGIPRRSPMPLRIVPDLCVEVMSSKRSYDRITKRHVYAEAGVGEYWIVDLEDAAIELYRGAIWVRTERDVLRDTILPGFELELGPLLRPDP